jgi:CBS domain-containing protein
MWRARGTQRNEPNSGSFCDPSLPARPERRRCRMSISATVGTILNQKGHQVYSISPDATVFEAIQLMADKNIGALLVTSEEKLLGVISERDYTRNVALKGRSSRETKVREIISSPVVSATPDHSVEECMRLMTSHRVRHLPVLYGEKLVGIVSIGDLVNWTISAQDAAIEQLKSYIAGL